MRGKFEEDPVYRLRVTTQAKTKFELVSQEMKEENGDAEDVHEKLFEFSKENITHSNRDLVEVDRSKKGSKKYEMLSRNKKALHAPKTTASFVTSS